MAASFPPSWQGLSNFRNASVLKIGYLGAVVTPVYSAFVLRIESLLDVDIGLPWVLIALFAGSFFLTIGHLLNELVCPILIKEFQSLDSYRLNLSNYVAQQSTIDEQVRRFQRLVSKDEFYKTFPEAPEGAAEIFSDAVAIVLNNETQREQYAKIAGELTGFEIIWNGENTSLMAVRATISALYAIAALIALILFLRQGCIVVLAIC